MLLAEIPSYHIVHKVSLGFKCTNSFSLASKNKPIGAKESVHFYPELTLHFISYAEFDLDLKIAVSS